MTLLLRRNLRFPSWRFLVVGGVLVPAICLLALEVKVASNPSFLLLCVTASRAAQLGVAPYLQRALTLLVFVSDFRALRKLSQGLFVQLLLPGVIMEFVAGLALELAGLAILALLLGTLRLVAFLRLISVVRVLTHSCFLSFTTT